MAATHTATCKWCGNKYQKGNNALIFIKLGSDFCSTKCETAYNSAGGNVSNSSGNNPTISKEAERQIKLENEKKEIELKKIREEEKKIKDQETAEKTMKVYDFIKPYLKFIIPIYLIAFIITYFVVSKKNQTPTLIFFGIPLVVIIYLIYNAVMNKRK